MDKQEIFQQNEKLLDLINDIFVIVNNLGYNTEGQFIYEAMKSVKDLFGEKMKLQSVYLDDEKMLELKERSEALWNFGEGILFEKRDDLDKESCITTLKQIIGELLSLVSKNYTKEYEIPGTDIGFDSVNKKIISNKGAFPLGKIPKGVRLNKKGIILHETRQGSLFLILFAMAYNGTNLLENGAPLKEVRKKYNEIMERESKRSSSIDDYSSYISPLNRLLEYIGSEFRLKSKKTDKKQRMLEK